ncbi:MAG TPA: FliH/SctL family protein [Stenomitos sp.]
MALIKSNQLIQTGTAVVAGDQVFADQPQPTPLTPTPEASNIVIERVVPEQPPEPLEPEPEEQAYSEWETETVEMAPVLEDEGTEYAYQEPAEPEAPSDLFGGFDAERDALLEEAQQQAEAAAHEATGHLGAPDASLELEEAEATIRASYPDASAMFSDAMASVTPYIEQQAASALERVSIQAANDARWRELATAEEQVASLVDNFARRVMTDPPTEMAIHSLMAERETLLAEARMKAARLVQEAEERAAATVHEAQAQAARAILEIESKREQVLEQLRQQGYAEGYQEGRSQADEEGAKIVQDAMDALNRLSGLVAEEAKKNEEKILKLALGIAEKILMDEVEVRPEIVVKTLEVALNKVSDLEEVIIKVHPDDMPEVQKYEDAFRDRLKSVRKVEFVASPKIQKGGVFIETGSGFVDAQIKTQLSVIEEAFEAVRAEAAAEPLDMTGAG